MGINSHIIQYTVPRTPAFALHIAAACKGCMMSIELMIVLTIAVVLILPIVLLFLLLGTKKQLNARIAALEDKVAGLKHRVVWLAARVETNEEDSAGRPKPEQAKRAAERPLVLRQPGPQPPPEPSRAAQEPPTPEPESFPETLEDLVLPEEPVAVPTEQAAIASPSLSGHGAPEGAAPAGPPVEPSAGQSPVAAASTPPSPPPPQPGRWRAFLDNVDWEQFTGVKLFAWLGGLALFIAAGFFVKFSVDRNLIPPALRLAIGALTGIALIVASGRFRAGKYTVMRHTLAAGGIGVLYSVVFAATLYYGYLPKPAGFGLLALVSAAAFVLSVYYRGTAIAILGAVGAYLTPLLVSTGHGNLLLLLAYLAVVNAGLYQVVTRLGSSIILLVAAAGTLITLGLATWQLYASTAAIITAAAWIINLAVFTFFLWRLGLDPGKDRAFAWSGYLVYLGVWAVALRMLHLSGWTPLLVITASQVGAFCLTWRDRGWYQNVFTYSVLGFLAVLAWILLSADLSRFSMSFVLLLLYGTVGAVGPMALIWRYGLNKTMLTWLRVFPAAIVATALVFIFNRPDASFWFWPLLLALELVGIGTSLILRAFIQVVLLVGMMLAGGLFWLFHIPAEVVGFGFFLFTLAAGMALCVAAFVVLKKLPEIRTALHLSPSGESSPPAPHHMGMEQWLTAAPAAGVCLLLAASFLMPYPLYPHPGMATLVCFLGLVLFAVHRLGYEIPGAAALPAAAAAQAVCLLYPPVQTSVFYPLLLWSAVLFAAALAAPFLFFRDFGRWRRLWYAWAVYEGVQAVFILYCSRHYFRTDIADWLPLLMAVLKLPAVIALLRRLAGHPRRNSILAFHGGVLLFYLSTLPVLVLDHGWIGLTFVFEAGALLWLNQRIEHPGLRWVSTFMAPVGLLILVVHLPQLKPAASLPLLNAAVLSLAAGVVALAFSVTWAGYPHRRLRQLDLPTFFQWLTVAAGFLLVNLAIADLFAPSGVRFQIRPHGTPETIFLQSMCYAIAWTALGGLLRRMQRLPEAIRTAGLILVAAGTLGLIGLPLVHLWAVAAMRPFFNAGLVGYLLVLAMLFYLFSKEPWEENRALVKNLLLTAFLAAGFVAVKLESGTIFQNGSPFTLFSSRTIQGATFSAAGWIAYGLGMHLWPRRLDRPFRLTGVALIVIGLLKAVSLPLRFRFDFSRMVPLLNLPSLLFAVCLAMLVYLTVRSWDQRWPLDRLKPRVFWGIGLAVTTFAVLNIEIAAVFAAKGRPFSMLTHGSFAMQLAYSIGWLLYAIGLLVVGIRWNTVRVRWAAIAAIVLTALKIFIRDLWSLGQLYRVGSLVGLAVVLGLVSFLYQRFLSEGKKDAT
jgi:uncharacterized membrane protein